MADQGTKTERDAHLGHARDAKGMSRPKGAGGGGYRVSPGPDFVVVAEVLDMPEYDELARRLFRSSANIRNVRTFFPLAVPSSKLMHAFARLRVRPDSRTRPTRIAADAPFCLVHSFRRAVVGRIPTQRNSLAPPICIRVLLTMFSSGYKLWAIRDSRRARCRTICPLVQFLRRPPRYCAESIGNGLP